MQLYCTLLHEVFGNLDGIEGRTLLDLVRYQPEGDAIGVGQILADAAYIYIITILMEEGHGINLVLRIILELQAVAVTDSLLEFLYADGTLCLGPDTLAVAAE